MVPYSRTKVLWNKGMVPPFTLPHSRPGINPLLPPIVGEQAKSGKTKSSKEALCSGLADGSLMAAAGFKDATPSFYDPSYTDDDDDDDDAASLALTEAPSSSSLVLPGKRWWRRSPGLAWRASLLPPCPSSFSSSSYVLVAVAAFAMSLLLLFLLLCPRCRRCGWQACRATPRRWRGRPAAWGLPAPRISSGAATAW